MKTQDLNRNTRNVRMRKLFPLMLVASTLALVTSSALAENCDGGICGGGGERVTSTEDEVKKAVAEIDSIYATIEHVGGSDQLFNPQYIRSSILKRALQRGVGFQEAVIGNATQKIRHNGDFKKNYFSPVQLKDKCFDEEGNEVEAFTNFYRGAPICLSKERLMKNSPQELCFELG